MLEYKTEIEINQSGISHEMTSLIITNLLNTLSVPSVIVNGFGQVEYSNAAAGDTILLKPDADGTIDVFASLNGSSPHAHEWLRMCCARQEATPGVFRFKSISGELIQFQLEGLLIQPAHLMKNVRVLIRFLPASEEALKVKELTRRVEDLDMKLRQTRSRERELHHSATHDELTGLLNRRAFISRFAEVIQSERSSSSVWGALSMIDIDHFKRINDTHGHLIGDAVLQALARRFTRVIRGSDVCARYGGEEFVVLMTAPTDSVLIRSAERLRRFVASKSIATEKGSLRMTVSIGVRLFRVGGDCIENLERLIEDADQALYEAKSNGRNKVCVSNGDEIQTSISQKAS